MENFRIEMFDDFFEAVLKLKTKEDCRKFFEDVCTIKELQDVSQRLEVAKLLSEKKNYQEISKLTGASTATISRVNKCLLYGKEGYQVVLEK
ncbi:MAG: TrpR-like protein YerC/YecD [Clostridia bacterium]|nr:TrpR-like protein YerC/YecD [Clostridia bacterium]